MKQGAQIGPIQNKTQFDKLKACLENRQEGMEAYTQAHIINVAL